MGILKRFRDDERGATAIEYGLIAAFISMAMTAGAQVLGTGVSSVFTRVLAILTSV